MSAWVSGPSGPPRLILDNAATPLPAGIYQYAVTYLRNDDQESGARKAGVIELLAPGGIFLSPIAASLDPTVTHKVIYCTSVGGWTLYQVGMIDNETTTFLIDTVRPGASPLMTQFLQQPPAGDFLGYWRGWLLVAVDARLYPSEPYAPELFDWRKGIPMRDRITMIAPVHEGVWIGTDTQILFLSGDAPESWTFRVVAQYGVLPGALCFADGEVLGDGQAAGQQIALFASKQGLCAGHASGQLQNLTSARFAYPVQERGASIVRKHRGAVQFMTTMQGAETAGNVAE